MEKDLDRIRALGTDVIWLMPIHPIGQKERKGDLGSPYAIADYRKINPEFGTMEDFEHLVREIHRRDMKCIIDVVYNHTSPDSWLVENHPNGFTGSRTGKWATKPRNGRISWIWIILIRSFGTIRSKPSASGQTISTASAVTCPAGAHGFLAEGKGRGGAGAPGLYLAFGIGGTGIHSR